MQQPTMTHAQMRELVRRAYKPTTSREYTDDEVDAEIGRLFAGSESDTLDDFSLQLYARLHCAY